MTATANLVIKNTGYLYKLAANLDIPEFYVIKQAINMMAPHILPIAYIILLIIVLIACGFVLTRKNSLQMVDETNYNSKFCWYITVVFVLSLISFSQVSTFIYFNL